MIQVWLPIERIFDGMVEGKLSRRSDSRFPGCYEMLLNVRKDERGRAVFGQRSCIESGGGVQPMLLKVDVVEAGGKINLFLSPCQKLRFFETICSLLAVREICPYLEFSRSLPLVISASLKHIVD